MNEKQLREWGFKNGNSDLMFAMYKLIKATKPHPIAKVLRNSNQPKGAELVWDSKNLGTYYNDPVKGEVIRALQNRAK